MAPLARMLEVSLAPEAATVTSAQAAALWKQLSYLGSNDLAYLGTAGCGGAPRALEEKGRPKAGAKKAATKKVGKKTSAKKTSKRAKKKAAARGR